MRSLIGLAAVLAVSLPLAARADAPTPADIVDRADKIRSVGDAFSFDLTIQNADTATRKSAESRYKVFVKGREKSVVKFVAPAVDAGKAMLMVGENLWMYFPTADRPLRLSLQQRLFGNVSNGDVARVNFGGDYDAKLESEEKAEGKDAWKLSLTAKKGVPTTYDKVTYWVEKGTFHPLKAEFFAASGKLVKTAAYKEYKPILGTERPTIVDIQDGIQKSSVSRMTYSGYEVKELKDSMFQQDNLKYLQ